ncbi:uncharacterized protein LOC118771264 [Megalops cyprinoides]|uniref:uncharacterized protein LOC118771264 n=1 Tax=Megalops cyprinoides TaxID=118141 RepID=UPI0018645413|nr:uncharacterized protein LOC118771264 [Megalops cyprinoides]
MFSDSRQLGKHRVFQHNNNPQRWLHNGVTVQRDTGHMGPSRQAEASLLPPDRRRETAPVEEKGNAQEKERTETNFDGQNIQRKLLLAQQKRCTLPDSVGQSVPRESNTARWNQAPEPRQRYSVPVREHFSDYACTSRGYQTEPHPSGRKYVPPPPIGFKGHQSYRVPGYMVRRRFWGYAREDCQRELNSSGQASAAAHGFDRHYGSNSTFHRGQEYIKSNHSLRDLTKPKNQPEQGCNGPSSVQGLIFSTEVPQIELDCTRQRGLCWPSSNTTDSQNKHASSEQGQSRESGFDGPKMSQAAIRDQIRRVVGDLEGVLGGLKQVHLEMKEVVQQIELLTSNIDLGEEEPSNSLPSDTLCSSSSSGVMVSSHKMIEDRTSRQADADHTSLKSTPTRSTPPALNPSVVVANQAAAPSTGEDPLQDQISAPATANPPQTPLRGQDQESRRDKDGSCPALSKPTCQPISQSQAVTHEPGRTASRSRKPPPYPYNGQVAKMGKGKESLKAPPYPTKRRLLSTMV